MNEAVGLRVAVPDSLAVTVVEPVGGAEALADVDPVPDPVKVVEGVAPLLNVGVELTEPLPVRVAERVTVAVAVADPDPLTAETDALGVAVAVALPLTDAVVEPVCEPVPKAEGLTLCVAVGVKPCVTVPLPVADAVGVRLLVALKDPVCVPVKVPLWLPVTLAV